MTEWPGDVLGRTDGPRPISPELRDQLEEALLGDGVLTDRPARPLGDDLSARLQTALGDPFADVLAGIDGPRPIRPATGEALEHSLRPRAHRRQLAFLGAAAAAVALVAGVTVTLSGVGRSSPGPSAQASAEHRARAQGGQGRTGSDAVAGAQMEPRRAGLAAPGSPVPGTLGSATPSAAAAQPGLSPPGVVTLSPRSGPSVGDSWVTVTGTGFGRAVSVHFGITSARFNVVSSDQLRVQVPTGEAGTVVDVTVTTAAATSAKTPADRFTYKG